MQGCHASNGVRLCNTRVCHQIVQYVLQNLMQGAAYKNVSLVTQVVVSPFNYMEMS